MSHTDPNTSRSSMPGFSGTFGGAWTLGAGVTATAAETNPFLVAPFKKLQNYQDQTIRKRHVYLVEFLLEAPPSRVAQGACLRQLCLKL